MIFKPHGRWFDCAGSARCNDYRNCVVCVQRKADKASCCIIELLCCITAIPCPRSTKVIEFTIKMFYCMYRASIVSARYMYQPRSASSTRFLWRDHVLLKPSLCSLNFIVLQRVNCLRARERQSHANNEIAFMPFT